VEDIVNRFGEMGHDELENISDRFTLAGRVMSIRSFGKAAFITIKDGTGSLQAYIRKDKIGDDNFSVFNLIDIGDHVGLSGTVFRTKTDELTIVADAIEILSKSQRPLPEKYHGLMDIEARYRQRYLDLIVNDEVRETFILRSTILKHSRVFL